MNKLIYVFIFSVITVLLVPIVSKAAGNNILTPQLQEQIKATKSGDLIRINITLKEQLNSKLFIKGAQIINSSAGKKYLISKLKELSAFSQKGVIAELNNLQKSKGANSITTYWIANVISCYATPEAISVLQKRSDIESIDYDEYRVLLSDSERKNSVLEYGKSGSEEITWNVLKVNADDVWALGYNGEGVIVSIIDTGVNYNHLDLKSHVWEDPNYPNHGYDFFNNDNDPMDDYGHGTHCAGTIAGDGTAGSQTGVAPKATIMCLKALNSSGGGYESNMWSAIQFSVEHGANLISMSLGWLHAYSPNRAVWRQIMDNTMAAGIIASVAAGNSGDELSTYPIPDNVGTPSDCPPPWLNPDQTLQGGVSGVISVGATTSSDLVSSFSSRGPVDWSDVTSYNDYPYNPEMGLIRPDVVAPGSNIKSLSYSSNTGYLSGWDGTSMATPCCAGVIALMLQKNNKLPPSEICKILEQTAVKLQKDKNNNSGSGRIDALAAIEAVPFPGPVYYSHSINDELGNNNGKIEPSELIKLGLSLINLNEDSAKAVTVKISTQDKYVTLIDSVKYFGDFSAGSIIKMENAFSFQVANNIPDGEAIKFNIISYNDSLNISSSFSVTANGVIFNSNNISVDDHLGNNNSELDPNETVNLNFVIKNNGQVDAPSTLVSLISDDSDVVINTNTINLDTLKVGEDRETSFNVTVNQKPYGSNAQFVLKVVSGGYVGEKEYSFKVGKIVEDFETGDFSKLQWNNGAVSWTIDDTNSFEGKYAARSNVITNSSSTELKFNANVIGNDSIAFHVKVSSEKYYDYFNFYIDDVLMGKWSGEVDWKRVSYPVNVGEHTFRWVYEKDREGLSGDDCGWVDLVELPPVEDMMIIYAGKDDSICEGNSFQTQANGINYESLFWQTSGSGSFNDNTSVDAVYFPSNQDYSDGFVALSLTATKGENSITDGTKLYFKGLPSGAGSISGAVSVMNGTDEVYTIDTISNSDRYNWVMTPSSAGTINGTKEQVIINWDDYYTGNVVLKVQGENNCGVGAFSSDLTITVSPTGINDFNTDNVLIYPNPSNGTFNISVVQSVKATITDISGKVIFEQQLSNFVNNISLKVGAGIYLIKLETSTQSLYRKIVIQ